MTFISGIFAGGKKKNQETTIDLVFFLEKEEEREKKEKAVEMKAIPKTSLDSGKLQNDLSFAVAAIRYDPALRNWACWGGRRAWQKQKAWPLLGLLVLLLATCRNGTSSPYYICLGGRKSERHLS